MILDERSKFSEAQGSIVTGGTVSTNVYDLGAMGTTHSGVQLRRRVDQLGSIKLLAKVATAFTVGGGFTHMEVQVQESSDNSTFTEVMTVKIPLAELGLSETLRGLETFPRNIKLRYVRMLYTAIGANPGAGAVTIQVVSANDASYKGNA